MTGVLPRLSDYEMRCSESFDPIARWSYIIISNEQITASRLVRTYVETHSHIKKRVGERMWEIVPKPSTSSRSSGKEKQVTPSRPATTTSTSHSQDKMKEGEGRDEAKTSGAGGDGPKVPLSAVYGSQPLNMNFPPSSSTSSLPYMATHVRPPGMSASQEGRLFQFPFSFIPQWSVMAALNSQQSAVKEQSGTLPPGDVHPPTDVGGGKEQGSRSNATASSSTMSIPLAPSSLSLSSSSITASNWNYPMVPTAGQVQSSHLQEKVEKEKGGKLSHSSVHPPHSSGQPPVDANSQAKKGESKVKHTKRLREEGKDGLERRKAAKH
mmetsp:Transcript_3436/g.6785  ORF Transcript_3436/g.6785 Transcript_3436/m.6785 type:complete len:324 (-) Transcript_3436:655-1626(-)